MFSASLAEVSAFDRNATRCSLRLSLLYVLLAIAFVALRSVVLSFSDAISLRGLIAAIITSLLAIVYYAYKVGCLLKRFFLKKKITFLLK